MHPWTHTQGSRYLWSHNRETHIFTWGAVSLLMQPYVAILLSQIKGNSSWINLHVSFAYLMQVLPSSLSICYCMLWECWYCLYRLSNIVSTALKPPVLYTSPLSNPSPNSFMSCSWRLLQEVNLNITEKKWFYKKILHFLFFFLLSLLTTSLSLIIQLFGSCSLGSHKPLQKSWMLWRQ